MIKIGAKVKYIDGNMIKKGQVVRIDKGLFSKTYVIENDGFQCRFVDRVKEKNILDILTCDN